MGEPPSAAGLVAPSGGVLLVAPRSLRSCRRSRLGLGRNSCRSQLGRDSPRKETVEPAARHGVRTRKRQVDGRHDCQDNAPACVPSTVWARRRGETAKLGSAPCLPSITSKLLSRHPHRVSRSKPQRARPPANATHSSTKARASHPIPIHRTLSLPESRLAPSNRAFSPPTTTLSSASEKPKSADCRKSLRASGRSGSTSS